MHTGQSRIVGHGLPVKTNRRCHVLARNRLVGLRHAQPRLIELKASGTGLLAAGRVGPHRNANDRKNR
jgi:hypothetical protein